MPSLIMQHSYALRYEYRATTNIGRKRPMYGKHATHTFIPLFLRQYFDSS